MDSDNQTSRNDKRQRIIDVALKSFSHRGFYRTRISDIAKDANVADGTVYLYFKGKEDMLTAIFDQFMERFLNTLQSELKGIEGAPRRLQRIIELHLKRLGENRDLSTVVQIELRHTSRFMDMYSRGRLRDYFLLIDSVLKAGKQEGSIRSDLNTWFATKCIFGVVDEAATNWVLSKHNYRLHSMVDPIMEFIMAGIKPS
jgi:TetR/AcrR family fatty acid metabolism transcriptional regulator